VKRNLAPGMQLLGDAVARPRFDEKEWKRVHDLWVNDLKQRANDPDDVAHVVETVAVYGADHPYGHPVDGFLATAPKVQLPDAKRFYAEAWRPDRAVVVAAGDVTRAELDAQIEAAFGAWKKPASAPLPVVAPPAPADASADAKPPAPDANAKTSAKVVLVDRPEATQSVVLVARPGVTASDPRTPALKRANLALGGTFTSRLMQDLREEHGWSYGARSGVLAGRGVGTVSAWSSVILDKTVDALKAMLADIDDFSHTGLNDDEVEKTRTFARNHLVEAYQTVEHASMALANDAALGLGPDFEAKASVLGDSADKRDLNKLASIFYDRSHATIILVGPRAKLEAPLAAAGFTSIDLRDAEGNPVASANAPADKAGKAAPAAPKAGQAKQPDKAPPKK
jgi:predicted Zn-dependent peptidase